MRYQARDCPAEYLDWGMSTNFFTNVVAAVIYQMLVKHSRCGTKDPAYEWSIHLNLFHCARNALESSLRLRTLRGIWTDRKESFQKFWSGIMPMSPVQDGNWQNLCDVSQRRSCGSQMSCSIWEHWLEWSRLGKV